MVEKIKEEVKKEIPTLIVVQELPKQSIQRFVQDGIEYEAVTIEEALTEILKRIRRVDKSVG
jgi:hypothetical protein